MRAEIVCIIDRSGSMLKIKDDAIGGFNNFLADQKQVPGEVAFSLIQFDHEYNVVYDCVPLQSVEPLTNKTYAPRGTTALLDAIGRTVTTIGDRLNKTEEILRPQKVIVVILTDGLENASREYKRNTISEMVKHQQEKYSWEFLYLGANQDAFTEAGALGINRGSTTNFDATDIGTRHAYGTLSAATTAYRVGAPKGSVDVSALMDEEEQKVGT